MLLTDCLAAILPPLETLSGPNDGSGGLCLQSPGMSHHFRNTGCLSMAQSWCDGSVGGLGSGGLAGVSDGHGRVGRAGSGRQGGRRPLGRGVCGPPKEEVGQLYINRASLNQINCKCTEEAGP